MTFEQFGEELKQYRIQKQLSLMDISSETRINLKFLEALEKGKFHVLPQTYVRAFLREYSHMVEIDPETTLQRYNEILKSLHQQSPSSSSPSRKDNSLNQRTSIMQRFSTVQIRLTLVVLGLVAVIIVLWLTNSPQALKTPQQVTEVPFEKVIRENEATSLPQDIIPKEIVPVQPKIDSLHLDIKTTDSVWISILIDNKNSEDHLFPPNRKHSWIAKDRFSITMGNAGGATFQLNGKNLGALGKRGAVLRNATITLKNLETP